MVLSKSWIRDVDVKQEKMGEERQNFFLWELRDITIERAAWVVEDIVTYVTESDGWR